MNNIRRERAKEIRIGAAMAASMRFHPEHKTNGDEQKFTYNNGDPTCVANFTKGLPHDYATGLVATPNDYQQFIKGIYSSDPEDFIATPLGPIGFEPTGSPVDTWKTSTAQTKNKLRAWESQAAGNLFDLEGPDAQSLTMPPCPTLGSAELTAEMGEVYVQALLRDVPFTEIVDAAKLKDKTYKVPCDGDTSKTIPISHILEELKALAWFAPSKNDGLAIKESNQNRKLGMSEKSRLRKVKIGKNEKIGLCAQTVFRGITPGDDIGPYISQFLLVGSKSLNGEDEEGTRSQADGLIAYGAMNIDQKVRIASPCKDYMTSWDEWYDVQQAADFSKTETYSTETDPNSPTRRFITTPRDLATYVHYDALYQAYLNACLILMAEGTPLDPGIPYQEENHIDHQQGFAHFGGPHILSLVTEVATRALKAVRFQKFNIHRRMRPEVLAARLAKQATSSLDIPELGVMVEKLQPILDRIDAVNGQDPNLGGGNYLLPMAFAEGSPMHPAYGAGHATVAGACVTILKAFFNHSAPLDFTGQGKAYVPNKQGTGLAPIPVIGGTLTVEGELNKLASNIAIGRDWAGVHYFTDYIESLRMGEQIAIGILQEQKLCYNEPFSMTLPMFDGNTMSI